MNTTSLAKLRSTSAKADAALKPILVIVDSNVADADKLVAGVLPQAAAIVLDPSRDGVLQITEALQLRPYVTSLHIICHGEPGRLFLGNAQLSLETLERYAWDLQSWFSSRSSNTPTVLLYGCHVAAGIAGADFLTKLHQLTGAGIAASTSLTGNVAQGGNWELEARIGSIKPELAISAETQASYQATFGLGSFSRVEYSAKGKSAKSIATGDFNNDGNLDLAVANEESNTVSILLGNGMGGFNEAQVFASGDQPRRFAVGDFNGDGNLDVVTANYMTSNISVLLGDGQGNLASPISTVIFSPDAISVSDVNQDQKLDLVVGPQASQGVLVMLGNGDGSFSTPTSYGNTSTQIKSIASGDLDGDNNPDLVTTNYNKVTFSVLLNDGLGNWGTPTDTNVGLFSTHLALGDLDNDDDVDLVVFNKQFPFLARILLNNGSGNFGTPSEVNLGKSASTGILEDIDSDGKLDLIAVSNLFSVEVLLGDGTGKFGAPTSLSIGIGNDPQSVVMADFNKDGRQDLGVVGYQPALRTSTVSVLLQVAPNTAPTSVNKRIGLNEDTLYAFQASDFAFTDTDNGDSLKKVKITSLPHAGGLFLDGDVDDSLDSSEAISLNQEIAVADLPKLKFKPAEDASGNTYTRFLFQVSDGKAYSSNSTIIVNVTAQNDAPVIEGVTAQVKMDEDSSPTAFALTLNATDVEKDTLTWSIKTAAISGTASVDNTGKVSYTPNPNYNGTDSFDVQVSDGNGGSDTITVEVEVAAQQDAPTAQDKRLEIAENSIYTFKASDFSFDDIDQGDSLQEVQITSLPNAGTLLYDGQAVTLDQKISVADLNKLTFAPTGDDNGQAYASFGFKVSDGKAYSSQARTVTVDVINDPDSPIIAEGNAITINMDEDGAPTAFDLTLSATDADKDSLFWSIKSSAAHGIVDVNETGQVSYMPTGNYNGTDSFEIAVSDDSGNTDAITVNVKIAAQNDAPTTRGTTITIRENQVYSFKSGDFAFADVDGDGFKNVRITSVETVGELFLDTNGNDTADVGEAISAVQRIDVTDIAKLKFKPAQGSSGAPDAQFDFQVGDGKAFSSQATLSIDVTPSIDVTSDVTPLEKPIAERPPVKPSPEPISETGKALPAIDFRGNKIGLKLKGSKQSETIQGTPFRDVIFGNGGNDRIFPGFRKQRFGHDRVFGGQGNDFINGGQGNDWLEGNAGNDTLLGSKGRDNLNGGDGDDALLGGKGHDIITGGVGNDILTGGKGQDMFVYSFVDQGNDLINDFNVQEDLLDLRGIFSQGYTAESSFAQYQKFVKLEQVGTTVAVNVDADGTGKTFALLTSLNNVVLADLTSKNFVLA